MSYSVFCNSCLLRKINGTYYCTSSSVTMFFGLRALEKTWTFWDAYNSWAGTQMLFRRKWRRWDKIQFYFLVLVIVVASINGTIFSRLWVMFLFEVLSYCTFTKTFAIVFQKWFDHDWIDSGVFLIKCASFCCRHTCMNWSLEKSLKYFSLSATWKFFET